MNVAFITIMLSLMDSTINIVHSLQCKRIHILIILYMYHHSVEYYNDVIIMSSSSTR